MLLTLPKIVFKIVALVLEGIVILVFHRRARATETLKKVNQLVKKFEEQIGELGNSRFVRNIFDRCIANQCNRLAASGNPSKEDLKTFLPADVPSQTQLAECLL